MAYLPLEPLQAEIDRRGGMVACLDRAKIHEEVPRRRLADALKHARHRKRMTVAKVDDWCIDVLGVMPQDIYGEAWWAA